MHSVYTQPGMVWKMYQYGEHIENCRKQMKRGYSKVLYNQRNKRMNETIISVIKKLHIFQINKLDKSLITTLGKVSANY